MRLADALAGAGCDFADTWHPLSWHSLLQANDIRVTELVLAGEDLLQASADKPFRFPATFTFVVRSFTVLDGIGKSLSNRFDITEIAAPYARGLLLEAKPQVEKLQQEFNKRLARQVDPLALPYCRPAHLHVLAILQLFAHAKASRVKAPIIGHHRTSSATLHHMQKQEHMYERLTHSQATTGNLQPMRLAPTVCHYLS